MERNAVGLVAGHVVRQLRRQHEGHIVPDVVVRAVLRIAGLASGIVGVDDLLLEGRLLSVLHAAGQRRLVRRRLQLLHGDLAGRYVAGQPGQHSAAVFAVPCNRVLRRHREGDGRGRQITLGRLGLRQHILAVVQALEAESVCFRIHGPRLDDIAVLVQLLQLELSAGQGRAILGHLVDIHLIGEHDHGVLRGLLLLGGRLALVIVAVDVRVAQLRRVGVALSADVRVGQQLSLEGQHHCRSVQRCADLFLAPRQLLGEALARLLRVVRQLVRDVFAAQGDLEVLGLAELARLQRVVERNAVGLVAGHVVRQLRRQHEGHIVPDVVVRAVLRIAGLASGIVGVDDLLLEGRLLSVLHAAGQRRLVRRRLQLLHGDLAGRYVAGQRRQCGSVAQVPFDFVIRGHREGNGRGRQITIGRLGLRQHIGAVVQACKAEPVRFRIHGPGLDDLAVLIQLLQLERRAGQGRATLGHLVYIHLVGEHDDAVLVGRLLGDDGRSVGIEAADVAVGQPGFVDVARAAQLRIFVQRGGEQHLDIRAVQGFSDAVAVPGQGQLEVMIVGSQFLSVSVRRGYMDAIRVKGQAVIHRVVELDAILTVVRHVVGQRGGQLEGYFIADVVVGGILPTGLLAGRVVDVLNLLLEGGLNDGGVGEVVDHIAVPGTFGLLRLRAEGGHRHLADRILNLHGIVDALDCSILGLIAKAVAPVGAVLGFENESASATGRAVHSLVQLDGDVAGCAAVGPGLGTPNGHVFVGIDELRIILVGILAVDLIDRRRGQGAVTIVCHGHLHRVCARVDSGALHGGSLGYLVDEGDLGLAAQVGQLEIDGAEFIVRGGLSPLQLDLLGLYFGYRRVRVGTGHVKGDGHGVVGIERTVDDGLLAGERHVALGVVHVDELDLGGLCVAV